MSRVVAAPADFDIVSAPTFEAELADADDLVIDCSEVVFIDSSGLQVLLQARTRALAGGGAVVLRRPTEVVLRLLKVTATDDLFTIERD